VKRFLSVLLVVLAAASPLKAVEPDEVLKDQALETRARALSSELRCLVCQNQSIDDSHAPLARDLRLLVRQKLSEGETDEAVRAFLVARYGDFILLKPRFSADTLLLWISPFAVLGIGAWALFVRARRQQAETSAELSEAEKARLAALLAADHRQDV
jgi:cytochrome c-type biogenesis protein CcmH